MKNFLYRKTLKLLIPLICFLLIYVPLDLINVNGDSIKKEQVKYQQVLILFSYDLANQNTHEKYDEILEKIRGIENVNFSFEFLSANNPSFYEFKKQKAEEIFHKYEAALPFDLIVAFDDEALQLVDDFYDFDDRSPVLFSGIDNIETLSTFKNNLTMTGFYEYLGIFETTEVAKTLYPDAENLYFLFDHTLEAEFYNNEIKTNQDFFDSLGLETHVFCSSQYSFDEVGEKLASFTEYDLVIFHSFYTDRTGYRLSSYLAQQYIAETSAVPIFSLDEPSNNLLGGYVEDEASEVDILFKYLRDVLSGDLPFDDINKTDMSQVKYVFDKQVMDRFGIKENQLPDNAVVINKNNHSWEVNYYVVSSFLFLFFFLLILLLNAERKYAKSMGKLLEIENLNLEIKSIFNKNNKDRAIQESLFLLKERLSALLTAYIAYEPDLNKFSVIQQTDAENMPINTMVAHCNFEQNKIFKQQLLRNKVFINRKPRELVIASDEGDEKKVIQSCLFMPILDEGETEQFIVLLSDERVFRFTEKQITAFSAISTTLSSGLSMLEAKEKEEAYIKSIANMTKEMAYVIAHSPSMILMFDHDSNILDANEKAIELLGLEGKDLSTVKYIEFFHPDDLFFKHEIESFFYHFDEKENPRIVRLRLKTVKYGYRWFEWMVFVFAENGEIVKRISIGTDVTEEIEHEKKMDFILNHDSMTELYNTNYLQSQMDMVLNHQAVFCAYVDIRDFRKINENYGHLIGDEFLVQFSARLKQNFMDMENAFVVRVSGDEFAVVVKSEPSNILSKRDNVLNILHTINSTPIQCSGTMVPFYLNVGYSYYPELANSPKDVFRFSELAMFETKKNPSIGFRRFDWKLYEKEFKFQELNDEVKKAMENEEFEMFYQPIIQLNSPNKVYAESLLRWQHPTKGLLTPAYFIDFVEKNGQIIEIGRMTFVRVCKFIREKEKTGFSVGAISFNLSVSSLQIPNEAEYYINQMKDYGIDASQIVIEITESLFFDKNYEVSQNLEKFRSFGIIVAIDDFGMKYSTLSMLENVAYDVIKVDMHFTKNLGDRNADLVVNMIRELCNYNNKRCIVEGVEEKWQLDELKRRGFSEFQGYYFSRPIPGEQLVGFYKKKIE